MNNDLILEEFKRYRARIARSLVEDDTDAHWKRAVEMADGHVSYSSFESAWKASRETLVIELPPAPVEPEAPEDAIDDSFMDAYHAANRMRSACAKAIEAAGLKVTL